MNPLTGLQVVITRPRGQGDGLAARVQEAGGTALLRPLIGIEFECDDEARRLLRLCRDYDAWLVTSANGVRGLVAACERAVVPLSALPPGYALGSATARVAVQHGVAITVLERVQNAAQMAARLVADWHADKQRLLVVEGNRNSGTLPQVLAQHGHHVARLTVYRTVAVQVDEREWRDLLTGPAASQTAVVVHSPSAAETLVAACGPQWFGAKTRALVVCIGGTTARWLTDHGGYVDAVAAYPSDDEVYKALRGVWRYRRRDGQRD